MTSCRDDSVVNRGEFGLSLTRAILSVQGKNRLISMGYQPPFVDGSISAREASTASSFV